MRLGDAFLMHVSFTAAGEMLLREMAPSQTAERLPSSTVMTGSASSTCRCLFGRPSSDISPVQLHLHDSSRRRWNFDFVAMLPLPAGRFEWTRCAADTLPVPMSRSVNAPLVVAADSPDCKTGASTSSNSDVADCDF